MRKEIEQDGYFALIIVALTIVYFAVPSGNIQTFSFGKKAAAKQIVQTEPKALVSEVAAPKFQVTPTESDSSEIVPQTPVENLGKAIKIPVLMYHHVADLTDSQRLADPVESDLTVSPADFESEVSYFHDLGYHSVSVAQLYAALTSNTALPKLPIIFTFDDGYLDDFTNAMPILQKYGYTGSFAIATDLLTRPGYAQWSDVVNADRAGMEILSHTENHLDLTSTKYSEDDLRREIYGSKQKLEDKLGHPVDFFVYPYGHYNYYVSLMVSSAGYKMGFTTAYGMNQYEGKLLYEPRVRVHGVGGLDKIKTLFEVRHIAPALTSP